MAFDRNKFRQGLAESAKQSSESVNDRGSFKSYVKKGKRNRFTKIPEGTFVFDIIPYVVENDFGDVSQRFKAGSLQHNIDLWVHQNVGVNNDQVVCLAKTFGKPCPICEEKTLREARGATPDELKVFNPKRRCVYNIWIHDASRTEEAKGVQILEIAHFTLEKNLIDIAKNPITGAMTLFADPDVGKHICFSRKGTGMNNTSYSGHQLIDRQMPIPDAILEQAEDLTTLIDIPTYEQVFKKFHGIDGDQVPTSESVSAVNADAYAAPATSYPTYDTTSTVGGGSEQYGVGEVPFTPNVPPMPATAPAQQFSYAAPVPPVAQPAPAVACPLEQYGGKFGETLDKFPQCGTCAQWDACSLKYDETH